MKYFGCDFFSYYSKPILISSIGGLLFFIIGCSSHFSPPLTPPAPPAYPNLSSINILESYKLAEENYSSEMSRFFADEERRLLFELPSYSSQGKSPALRIKFTSYYYFFDKDTDGASTMRLMRGKDKLSGESELVFDFDSLQAKFPNYQVVSFRPSPSNKHIAFVLKEAAGLKNLLLIAKSGKSENIISGPDNIHSFEWGNDDNLIFFLKYDLLHAREFYRYNPFLAETPQLISSENRDGFSYSIKKSKDGKFLFLMQRSTKESDFCFIDLNSPQQIQKLEDAKERHHYNPESANGNFIILNTKPDSSSSVLSLPFNKHSLSEAAQIFKISAEDTFSNPEIFSGRLIGNFRQGLNDNILIIDLLNSSSRLVLPKEYFSRVQIIKNPDFEDSGFFYKIFSPHKTAEIYFYNFNLNKSQFIWKDRIETPLIADDYNYNLKFVKSHDNIEIPLLLVTKKGSNLKNTPKLVLKAYGAYGQNLNTELTSENILLLENGYTLAFAMVRGGGEYGEKWHRDGSLLNKKNSVYDFLACAEYLHNEFTQIIVSGKSAGGLLVASSVLMMPDLFAAAIIEAPFLDVRGQMSNSSLALTPYEYEEWGDARQEIIRNYIAEYSPYDLKIPDNLPPILILSAENDEIINNKEVLGWSYKIRSKSKNKNYLLVRNSQSAGHDGESLDYLHNRQIAFKWAYIDWLLNPEK